MHEQYHRNGHSDYRGGCGAIDSPNGLALILVVFQPKMAYSWCAEFSLRKKPSLSWTLATSSFFSKLMWSLCLLLVLFNREEGHREWQKPTL